MSVKKAGRPSASENRERLVSVTFRADADTLEALSLLSAAVGSERGTLKPRSIAIRRALVEAADRLRRRGQREG